MMYDYMVLRLGGVALDQTAQLNAYGQAGYRLIQVIKGEHDSHPTAYLMRERVR